MTSLQKKNFNIFAIGMFVSLLGSQIQMISMPLFILDITGSGTLTGFFTFLMLFPFILITPVAGVLGDRLNRKNIMVYMDIIRGFMVMFLAIWAFLFEISLTMIFIFQIFISVMDGIFSSSTSAMRADLVSKEDYAIANSKISALTSISGLIGPAIGGFIYSFGGIKIVFLINALSFLISGIAEIFIKYDFKSNNKKITINSFFDDVKEGVVFIKKQVGLKYLMMFAAITNFLLAPIIYVVFPYVFKETIGFSSEQYGLLQTGFTIGALLGSLIFGKYLISVSSRKSISFGLIFQLMVGFFVSIVIFPNIVRNFDSNLWNFFFVVFILVIFWGFFNIIINIPIQTNMQRMAPSYIRARVFSVVSLIFQGAVPVGSILYGFFVDFFPAHIIMLISILLSAFVSILFLIKSPDETFESQMN
ncbi:putative MFS family arabinose efflux permease [Oceanotoga teriensis]|jgi:MFS family permease|uniref:MFS family arabinose efflux permease n=1 Tax=Oceanotoga teriensis TaxID=515440 RepID=A0AA45C6M3_9BACT|nr:MFS transporter [Oceanotoga teriensis]PWJ92196.1 putative MFS family arabinose efflux permease [Oceanotoga teriensis]